MTTEEKAKAYEMALEAARKELGVDRKEWEVVQRVLHNIFPELAESEDERIRKHLVAIVELYWGKTNDPDKAKELAYLEKQKEQKPELVQQPPITYTYHSDASRDERLKAAILALLNSDLIKVAGNKFTKQDLIEWVEKQKPSEWSEEDKKKFDNLLYLMLENNSKESWEGCYEWLENLPERFNLQLKGKWSEEDADILNCCISSIEEAKENRYAYKETDGDTSYDREINWLKSLRPSWKPSEEQMNALNALNCHGDLSYVGQQNQLISLYNDLKKLI